MAGNNHPLDTPEDTEGSTGWRAPVAPIEKLDPNTDQGLVPTQVLGVATDPNIYRCPRA